MKVERNLVPECTLDEFAEQHNLVMEVHERGSEIIKWIGRSGSRFYAHFKHCEVKDGCVLVSTFGNGSTEAEAIADYAQAISERLLVIDAGNPERREIQAPRLI